MTAGATHARSSRAPQLLRVLPDDLTRAVAAPRFFASKSQKI